jgi:hypothetical protein
MPRPGHRWSRRPRTCRAAPWAGPCPIKRPLEGRRLDPQLTEAPAIRHELVARVRRDIAAGAYDTPAKMEAALERLLTRLADD